MSQLQTLLQREQAPAASAGLGTRAVGGTGARSPESVGLWPWFGYRDFQAATSVLLVEPEPGPFTEDTLTELPTASPLAWQTQTDGAPRHSPPRAPSSGFTPDARPILPPAPSTIRTVSDTVPNESAFNDTAERGPRSVASELPVQQATQRGLFQARRPVLPTVAPEPFTRSLERFSQPEDVASDLAESLIPTHVPLSPSRSMVGIPADFTSRPMIPVPESAWGDSPSEPRDLGLASHSESGFAITPHRESDERAMSLPPLAPPTVPTVNNLISELADRQQSTWDRLNEPMAGAAALVEPEVAVPSPQVTIGRLEVRAVVEPRPPVERRSVERSMPPLPSLMDYLERRARESW